MISKSAIVSHVRRYVFLLTIFGLAGPVCLAQAQGSKADPGVAELLKKHDDAMNQHNLDGMLTLFAPGPKTVVIGTGPGERYQGREEIKTAYTEFFKDFDKGTLVRECYWKEGGGSDKLRWGAAMCKFTDAKEGKKREYGLNVSVVVEKAGDKWQFVMMHYSNLTGGQAPPQ